MLKDERRDLFADISPLEWREADGERRIKLWDFQDHAPSWPRGS